MWSIYRKYVYFLLQKNCQQRIGLRINNIYFFKIFVSVSRDELCDSTQSFLRTVTTKKKFVFMLHRQS